MRIILSPAKTMTQEKISSDIIGVPVFLEDSKKILSVLKEKDFSQLKEIWRCNDKIANENFEHIKNMNLTQNLTNAVLTYNGITFKHIFLNFDFKKENLDYLENNLRILSGFYGVLKPFDGITPYRLEMQSKIKIDDSKDLYSFWGDKLYNEVKDKSNVIINLASKEYSKCIEKYLKEDDIFITCSFVEKSNGKFVVKGTYSKIARGEMVRYMTENNIQNYEDLKKFNHYGYIFREELSSNREYVFERIE